jgi:tripartite-type tricarboxylate transporter receptor subunit TctC
VRDQSAYHAGVIEEEKMDLSRTERDGTILQLRWMVALTAVFAISASHAQTAWKPEKGVEIVVGTSPGGGQDTSARFVQKLMQDKQLVATPTVVLNKPGGGSSVGYAYLNQHPGDGHFIMLLTVPLITNHILGLSQIGYTDLSPLAVLFDDYIVHRGAAVIDREQQGFDGAAGGRILHR